jgi:uncharacterized OsmC-like protein
MPALDEYLGRKTAALHARQADFSAQPDKARVMLTASSRLAGNSGVRPVTMGAFSVISDSSPGLAGYALGPTAPELLLGALASCLVHTYAIQAVLLGIGLDAVEVSVSGTLDYRGVVGLPVDEAPIFTELTYTAHVESPADADAIARLHQGVEVYCPVLNTLRMPVAITRAEG